MKTLYKITDNEKKFRGIFNSEMLEDSFEDVDVNGIFSSLLSRLGVEDFEEVKEVFGVGSGVEKANDALENEVDDDNSAEKNDNNATKISEEKKTITKKYETTNFTKNILANAEKFIGLNEADDGDNDRQKIREFHKAANLNASYKTAWCASFVSYVLKNSGINIKGSARAKDFLKKGKPIKKSQLQKGDIIVYNRKGGGHVGIFTGKYKNGVPVIIAGNTSDEVKEYADTREILGYRRFT